MSPRHRTPFPALFSTILVSLTKRQATISRQRTTDTRNIAGSEAYQELLAKLVTATIPQNHFNVEMQSTFRASSYNLSFIKRK